MSEKYKHSDRLEDLLRYMNNGMTNEERYLFEREIERDPFLNEAFEGLSDLKPSEIDRDIRSLDVYSGKKRRNAFALKILAYAAGIAIVISLGYWGIQSIHFSKQEVDETVDDSMKQLVTEPYKPVVAEKVDTSAVVDSSSILVADANTVSQTGTTSVNSAVSVPAKEAVMKVETLRKKMVSNNGETEEGFIAPKEEKKQAEVPVGEPQNTVAAAQVYQEVNGEDVAEPEALLRRPGANAEPAPLGGNDLYKDYLVKNTRYPVGVKNPKKEIVKIRFKITKTGEPKDFFIERSPDDNFSQEAIRLIKSGPKWSPKIKDGLPVEGEAEVKIYFRPE